MPVMAQPARRHLLAGVACAALLVAVGGAEGVMAPMEQTRTATVFPNGSLVMDVLDCDGGLACATLLDSGVPSPPPLPLGGWASLQVDAAGPACTAAQNLSACFYAAGVVEGGLTAGVLSEVLTNFWPQFFSGGKAAIPESVMNWVTQHLLWLRRHVAEQELGDARWTTMAALVAQMDGVVDGYNRQVKALGLHPIDAVDLLMLNMDGDLTTVCDMLNVTASMPLHIDDHCSSLIKITKKTAAAPSDLLFSHSTWDNYASMTRMFKRYTMPTASPSGSVTVSFSSTPGFLSSIDDFYVVPSTGLAVIETTNHVFNTSLYSAVSSTGQLLSWMRAMFATYTASTGQEWVEAFSPYNSGTYNCQWMVVDTKLFAPDAEGPSPGLFTVLEQLPGHIVWADKSEHLVSQGYWASYNVPAFPSVFNLSGWAQMQAAHGDYYSHDKCPRANIFRARAQSVQDEDDMKVLMRYNDPTDPLQLGSAGNGIMSRHDLEHDVLRGPGGGCDTKIGSASRLLAPDGSAEVLAILGPTNETLPSFQWSTSDWANVPHKGQPDLFGVGFGWVQIRPLHGNDNRIPHY